MDPFTIANLAGTGLQVLGGFGASKARKRAARRRAALQRAQAEERRRRVGLEVNAFKKKARVAMGENISAYAKAGVDISQSPLLVLGQNAVEAAQQASEIKRAGMEEARLMEAGANISLREARAEGQAAIVEGFGTLLGGIGRAFGR
jgi:hypothetical protein